MNNLPANGCVVAGSPKRLTIDEAAGRLGKSRRSVERMIAGRRIRYDKIGGSVRIDESEVERVILDRTVQPRDGGAEVLSERLRSFVRTVVREEMRSLTTDGHR